MVIKFNKNFYSLEAIKKSLFAFKKFANFNIKEKRRFIEVTVKDIDKEFKDTLCDDFSNYVLAEMKK